MEPQIRLPLFIDRKLNLHAQLCRNSDEGAGQYKLEEPDMWVFRLGQTR